MTTLPPVGSVVGLSCLQRDLVVVDEPGLPCSPVPPLTITLLHVLAVVHSLLPHPGEVLGVSHYVAFDKGPGLHQVHVSQEIRQHAIMSDALLCVVPCLIASLAHRKEQLVEGPAVAWWGTFYQAVQVSAKTHSAAPDQLAGG